jgi:hypothetical protein
MVRQAAFAQAAPANAALVDPTVGAAAQPA